MPRAIFIDGQAGTTGLGITRRLSAVSGIALLTLSDADRKSTAARQAAMRDAELIILCLPDDAAREAVTLAGNAARILDASTAHRVAPGWTYGFAELTADQPALIAAARRVSNPGCYATAAIALLRPLIAASLLPPDAPITINAVSGYSGGGKAMIAAHQAAGGPAYELYALGLAHKHLPEIVTHSGLTRTPIFVPSVAHTIQGMLLSIPLHVDLLAAGATPARVIEALRTVYPAGGQVAVVAADPAGRLRIGTLNDSDEMELTVAASSDGRSVVLIASLDNLGKGASGAAVQNTKLMLGLPP